MLAQIGIDNHYFFVPAVATIYELCVILLNLSMPVKTYFDDIQDTIISLLCEAKDEILVAVAWLTSKDLFEQLCRQAMLGTEVKVLILKDSINTSSGIDYSRLEKFGGKLYWQESFSNSLMHHKFCVIDKKTVITGSFNWTNKASQNRENITVLKNEIDSANTYIDEFFSLLPIVEDAIFFDEDYLPNTSFDTPQKRQQWFDSLSEEWKKQLEECADYPYKKTSSSMSISVAKHEYSNFDKKLMAMLRQEHIIISNVEDLSGLWHLSDLKTLTIQNNSEDIKINDIGELQNLIHLEELDLANNLIDDITPLRNLKKLRELDLSSNRISNIESLNTHRKIEVLNISDNSIDDISSIMQMYCIKDLRFNYNQVKDISSLESKEFLERLDFEDNCVEDLSPLRSCINLQTVACGDNLIKSIEPLSKLKRLKYLKCKTNPLEDTSLNNSKAFIY